MGVVIEVLACLAYFICAMPVESASFLKGFHSQDSSFEPLIHNQSALTSRSSDSSVVWQNGKWACSIEHASANKACMKCPSCLDPSGTCLTQKDEIFRVLPDCVKYGKDIPARDNSLCKRSLYRCPTTGVLTALPTFTANELDILYTKYYHGQADLTSVKDPRPVGQSQDIIGYGELLLKTGLTIVEMGAAAGYLLYNMRQQAANGGKLIAFEPGPDYAEALRVTLTAAKKDVPSLKAEVYTTLFRGGELAPNSVDVFMSSQVLEHWANPCDWLSEMKRIMKPGGIVFTEIPIQYYNFRHDSVEATEFLLNQDGKNFEGTFHISLFGRHDEKDKYGQVAAGNPYPDMMATAGFEQVWMAPTSSANRYIHRKPY